VEGPAPLPAILRALIRDTSSTPNNVVKYPKN
jgi:hypothetical protein